MASLAAGHGHAPAHQRGGHRVDEQQAIGQHEADRTHQVQRLVDAAVVVVAVVVPALCLELFEKRVHSIPLVQSRTGPITMSGPAWDAQAAT
ncbi:hypothetical protein FQZ97_1144160 [compost metagenome]